jgi:hypothetical protein
LFRNRRRDERISLREAADQSGVPAWTLARLEKGKKVDVAALGRVMRWLELSASFLVTTPGEPRSTPDVIEQVLAADRTLSIEARVAIASIVRDLYEVASTARSESTRTGDKDQPEEQQAAQHRPDAGLPGQVESAGNPL